MQPDSLKNKFNQSMKSTRMLILILLLSTPFGLFAHEDSGHSHVHDINTKYALFTLCKTDIEGYARTISGGEYTYPSIREDITKSLISRASTGKMAFELLTHKVPENYDRQNATFFFISNIDLNLIEPYDVFVNDNPLLTFKAKPNGELEIINNPGNGLAEYILIERDGNGDGMGAFRLTVPVSSLKKGKAARIKVVGQNMGSNSWFMIFKANDAIERLRISAENETSFSIKQFNDQLLIDAPGHFAGKEVYIESDGKKSKKAVFNKQGDLAKASVKIAAPNKTFALHFGEDVYEVKFPNENGIYSKSNIIGDYFYYINTQDINGWRASITKLYRPSFYNTYENFFDNKYEDGLVSILNSSHQDIAWVDRPEVCIMLRDTLLLTPIIKDAFAREDYGFDIEDGLMLREYLNRHPDAQEKLTTLLNKKLLSVGATYNCPYEDMYDAEDQVRQLYLGKKWVKKTFGGYDSKVYWNVDVPGKSLQTPQILKKAGVEYMIISRHARGLFHWESPDGSSIFTYSPGHYGEDITHLSKDLSSKIKYGAEQVVWWEKFFTDSKNHTPLLSDQDMLPAIDYSDFINAWNGVEKIKDVNGVEKQIHLPDMSVMTVDKYMPMAEASATSIDTLRGERPNVWIYIHGPAHHEALTASREASKLIPASEKFLSIANLIDPVKMPYPTSKLDEAWQAKIYPDHGWGGHDGDITDDLFKSQLVKSRTLGQDLLAKGLNFISGRVKTNEKTGIPVILFNSLSWERTDPVTASIQLQKGKAKSLKIITEDKEIISSQLTNAEYYKDGSLKSGEVVFIARDVPSIGYKTYYIELSKAEVKEKKRMPSMEKYENEAYTITFGNGGISQIFDKELKRNLLKTDNLKGAEVFTLESVGNGAGEFGDVQQPFMKDFDKVSVHNPSWKVICDGDVFSTYRIRQQILHAIVEQDVTIYHDLKRILFETKLLNWSGELYREFRTAFPIDMNNAQVSYEVPFGTVKVGLDEIKTAGERYTPLCKDVHPRAIIDWISASDEEMSVTLSSSVAAADWIDPTSDSVNPVLQHILLASRTSCHWEGNEYSQGGDHFYNNILTSNKTGELSGKRIAKQHNEPIYIIVNPEKSIQASLPEQASFFSIDKENVIITTVKKAEDSDDFIVRMYDSEGQNTSVEMNSFFELGKLKKTNIIEENPTPVTEMVVPKYSIETFSLDLK